MSWMTKHTNNLLGDMPIDNKASALNHNSLPVHQHPHSNIDPDAPGVPGTPGYEPKVRREDLDAEGKKIWDANRDKAAMAYTKELKDLPKITKASNMTQKIGRIKPKPIDGPKPRGIIKL